MHERRLKEIDLLRERYGSLQHGEDLEWIVFEGFGLLDCWNRQKTRLLVLVPPGYPVTPPDNFYVEEGLRTASGNMPANYTENQTHLGQQWGQFSFHAEKGHWRPSADVLDGDNLITFMIQVERRLEEAN